MQTQPCPGVVAGWKHPNPARARSGAGGIQDSQGDARILEETGEQSLGRWNRETFLPRGGIPMSLGIGQLSQGRAVTLPRVSSRERAAKPGRERRSIVGMISFHKEKGKKKNLSLLKVFCPKVVVCPLPCCAGLSWQRGTWAQVWQSQAWCAASSWGLFPKF